MLEELSFFTLSGLNSNTSLPALHVLELFSSQLSSFCLFPGHFSFTSSCYLFAWPYEMSTFICKTLYISKYLRFLEILFYSFLFYSSQACKFNSPELYFLSP